MPAANSPKSNLRQPVTTDTPDVVRDITQLVTDLDGRVATVCTSLTRPTGTAAYAGALIYETDTKAYAFYNGTAWDRYVQAQVAQGTAWTASATVTDVPGTSLTLGVGKWLITAKGFWDYAESTAQDHISIIDLNGVTLDVIKQNSGAAAGKGPFTLMAWGTVASGTQVVKVRAYVGALSGTQLLSNVAISAVPYVGPSF